MPRANSAALKPTRRPAITGTTPNLDAEQFRDALLRREPERQAVVEVGHVAESHPRTHVVGLIGCGRVVAPGARCERSRPGRAVEHCVGMCAGRRLLRAGPCCCRMV